MYREKRKNLQRTNEYAYARPTMALWDGVVRGVTGGKWGKLIYNQTAPTIQDEQQTIDDRREKERRRNTVL